MDPEELYKVVSYLFDRNAPEEEQRSRQNRLRLTPEEAVRNAAQESSITYKDEEIPFVGAVLSEMVRAFTAQSVVQKQRAEERINQSIQALKHAFRLTLVMHNVMFYLGITLIIIGAFAGLTGRAISGLVLGGAGLTDLIFFLLREPIEGTHESVGNLMQLRASYNSYFVQLEQWGLVYDYQTDEESVQTKQNVSELIHKYTEATLKLIQQYCKPMANDSQLGAGRRLDGT